MGVEEPKVPSQVRGHQKEPGDLRLPARIQGTCVLLPSWSTSKRCGFEVRDDKRDKRDYTL